MESVRVIVENLRLGCLSSRTDWDLRLGTSVVTVVAIATLAVGTGCKKESPESRAAREAAIEAAMDEENPVPEVPDMTKYPWEDLSDPELYQEPRIQGLFVEEYDLERHGEGGAPLYLMSAKLDGTDVQRAVDASFFEDAAVWKNLDPNLGWSRSGDGRYLAFTTQSADPSRGFPTRWVLDLKSKELHFSVRAWVSHASRGIETQADSTIS
jgi:hypothetical protein